MLKRKLHTSLTINIDWWPFLWINTHIFRHKINIYVFRINKSSWFLSLGMWLVLCFLISQVLLIVNLKCDWWVGWFFFPLLKPVRGPTIWLLRQGKGDFRKKYPADWFRGEKNLARKYLAYNGLVCQGKNTSFQNQIIHNPSPSKVKW